MNGIIFYYTAEYYENGQLKTLFRNIERKASDSECLEALKQFNVEDIVVGSTVCADFGTDKLIEVTIEQ